MDLPEFRLPWKVFSYSSYSHCASAYIVLHFSVKVSDIALKPHVNSWCITNFPDGATNKGNLTPVFICFRHVPAINKCVRSPADAARELNEFVNLSETQKPNIREWMLFVRFSRGLLRPRKCHPQQPRLLLLTPSFHMQSFYDVSATQLLFTLDFLLTGPSVCCNKKPPSSF